MARKAKTRFRNAVLAAATVASVIAFVVAPAQAFDCRKSYNMSAYSKKDVYICDNYFYVYQCYSPLIPYCIQYAR